MVDEPSLAWSVVSKWGASKSYIPALPLSVSSSLTQPKEVGSPKINLPNKNLIHPSAKSYVPRRKRRAALPTKSEVPPVETEVPPLAEKLVTLSEKKEMPLPEKKTSSASWARLFRAPKVAEDEADFPPLAKTRAPPQRRSAVLEILSVQPKTAVDDKPRPDYQHVPLSESKEVAPPDKKEVPILAKEEVPLPAKEEVPLPDKTKEPRLGAKTSGASWARLFQAPKVRKGASDLPPLTKTSVPPQDGRAIGGGALVRSKKKVNGEARPEKTFHRSFKPMRGQRWSRGSRQKRFPTDRSGPRAGNKTKEKTDNKPKPEDVDHKPKPPKTEEADDGPKPVEADSMPQQEEEASGKIIVSLPVTVMGTTPIKTPAPPNVEGEGSFDNKPKPEKEIGDKPQQCEVVDKILLSLPVMEVGTTPIYAPVPVRPIIAGSSSLLENMDGPLAMEVGTLRTETLVPRRKIGKESASLLEEKAGEDMDSEAETLVSQPKDHSNVSSPVLGVVAETFYTPIYGAPRGRAWDRKKACWDLTASTSLSLPDQLDDSNRSVIDSHVPNVAGVDLPHPDAFVIEDEPELPSLLGRPAEI